MKPFRARFAAESRRRFTTPLEQVTGVNWPALIDLTAGRLTLAWLPNPGASPKVLTPDSALLLVLDLEANTNAFDRLVASLATPDSGPLAADSVATSVVRGVTFLSRRLHGPSWNAVFDKAFPWPPDATPTTNAPDAAPKFLHLGRVGSWGVATTWQSDLGPIIDRLRQVPPAATAVGDILWEATVERAGLERLMHLPTPAAAADLASLPALNRLKVALGLAGIQRARFSAETLTNGWALNLAFDIPKTQRRGLFALLHPLPMDAAPPAFIPSNTLRFARLRLSGTNAWDHLERMLGDIDPAVLGVFQLFTGYAGRTEDADFDFQARVVNLLGDDWMVASGGVLASGAAPSNLPPGILLLGSPRASELAAGLRTVASPSFLATFFPPDTPEPSRANLEVQGQTVTTVTLPPIPWLDGRTGVLSIASSKGYCGVATDAAWTEAFLAPQGKSASLNDREDFRRAFISAGGPATGLTLYHDEQAAAREFFGAARRSPALLDDLLRWVAFSDTATRLVSGIGAWFDVAALPSFESVAHHFGPCVQCGRVDETGFVLRAVRMETTKP
ncbi:MAG: hypothetical protein JNK85_19810 [Verrucomicrobiales bacterium]|nr:hypothetical protein [Verrucomicrobiales bacterium]